MVERKTFRIAKYSGLPDGPIPLTQAQKSIKFVHSSHVSLTSSFNPSKDGKTLEIEIEESNSPRFVGEVSRLPSTANPELSAIQRVTQDGLKLFFKFPVRDDRAGQSGLGLRFQIRLNRLEDVSQIFSICHPFFHVAPIKQNSTESQIPQSQIYQSQVQQAMGKGTIPPSQLRPPDRPLPTTTTPQPAVTVQHLTRPDTTTKAPQETPRSTAEKRKTSPVDGMDDIKRKLMRNYVPAGGSSSTPLTAAGQTPRSANNSLDSQVRSDTVRMTPLNSQTQRSEATNYQATAPGTMQELGQASQMIETQFPPTQNLVDLRRPDEAPPSSGLDFPVETINYLAEPIQSAPTQDLISFEDPLGDMSQLNEEDREAIDSTYPPLYTGSGRTTIRATPKPSSASQAVLEHAFESELFELAGVAHLYTPSPVNRSAQGATTNNALPHSNPLPREVVRDALREFLHEEGFRQMVGEVASLLRDQTRLFLHSERYEQRHHYSYANGLNQYHYIQDPYTTSGSHLSGHSSGHHHEDRSQVEDWYQDMANPNPQHTRDQSPWAQAEAYSQQYSDAKRFHSRAYEPWYLNPQASKHGTPDGGSMIDDDFEAMMAEPCEA